MMKKDLRYLKNKDTYVYKNKTAGEVIQMICADFQMQTGSIEDTGFKIASMVEDNQTLFDIIQNALDATMKNQKYMYVMYDDFGKVTLKGLDNMDKREGSIIYDALAPAAVELQLMYIEFDIILQETFADTASREYLIRRAAERGIIPIAATHAILKGEFTPSTLNIPIGARFSCGTLNYAVTEKISDGAYKLECETEGETGNAQFGQMIPIDYIEGLETCYLTELLIPGEDEEATEDIRTRYFDTFDTKPFGGNQKDYIQKTNALPGVGSTKVTPVWKGGGTVLLTILDSNFDAASSTLVKSVQEAIDPDPQGEGLGIAPIDHIVTVNTATNVKVNVATSLTFDEGYSFNTLKSTITDTISAYKGNVMKRVGNLYSKICDMENLKLAHQNARKGKGWYQEVRMVDEDPEKYLGQLQEMLLNKTYNTSEYVTFIKHDSGKDREIFKLPYFPDRICQWAILQVIEPYLVKNFIKNTYSAIPGRGIHLALHDIDQAVQHDVPGTQYCLKIDARKYYPW